MIEWTPATATRVSNATVAPGADQAPPSDEESDLPRGEAPDFHPVIGQTTEQDGGW